VLGAVVHFAFALAAVRRAQILPHDAFLTPSHAAALAAAMADAQTHAALDVGAPAFATDATAAMSHTQTLALRAARASFLLTAATASMANAFASRDGVAGALRETAELLFPLAIGAKERLVVFTGSIVTEVHGRAWSGGGRRRAALTLLEQLQRMRRLCQRI
jgi:hypothetical protein